MSHAYNFTRKPVFSRSDKMAVIAGFSMIVTLILYHYFILPNSTEPSRTLVYTALFTAIIGAVTFVLTIFLWGKEVHRSLQGGGDLEQSVSSSDIDNLLMAHGELLPNNVAGAIAKGKRVSFKVGITIHE